MSVTRPPQRASFFDRVGEVLSRAGFGVLYLLNKAESGDASKGLLDFGLFVLSFGAWLERAAQHHHTHQPQLQPRGPYAPSAAAHPPSRRSSPAPPARLQPSWRRSP